MAALNDIFHMITVHSEDLKIRSFYYSNAGMRVLYTLSLRCSVRIITIKVRVFESLGIARAGRRMYSGLIGSRDTKSLQRASVQTCHSGHSDRLNDRLFARVENTGRDDAEKPASVARAQSRSRISIVATITRQRRSKR